MTACSAEMRDGETISMPSPGRSLPGWLPPGRGQAAYRWAVASRVIAASLGSYLLVSLFTALLGFLLPGPRAEAVLAATMLSFALWVCAVIWIFAARSATQAWRGVMAAIGLTGLALLLAQRWLA